MGGDKSGLLVEPTRTNAAAGAQWKALPRACTRPYRVVVRRKNVSKMKGEHMLVEGIRIFRVGLQRTNNMRRYTASSPISKRYTYTPVATARPCLSQASQVRRCSPAWRVSAASRRTRWPVRL